ncbi:MAG: ribbon-helix-helix protein, CopG family, partial [Synergistaceae bacterium]|nr:ribbon-helix-helix protein, CopG family [Synergistaceae bacterium]
MKVYRGLDSSLVTVEPVARRLEANGKISMNILAGTLLKLLSRKAGEILAKHTLQIRLDAEDIEWLDNEAYKAGSSRGAVIRALIRERISISRRSEPEAS